MALRRSRSLECIRPETEYEILKNTPRSRSCRKKSVQWSNNLEEVRYFEQGKTKAMSVKKKICQLKKRATALKDFPIKKLSVGASKTAWRKIRCLPRQSMSLDTGMAAYETYEEYNREWDILFEMYSVSSTKEENEITHKERTP